MIKTSRRTRDQLFLWTGFARIVIV